MQAILTKKRIKIPQKDEKKLITPLDYGICVENMMHQRPAWNRNFFYNP